MERNNYKYVQTYRVTWATVCMGGDCIGSLLDVIVSDIGLYIMN